MKNQYVGDIGDYGKYGLLRFLIKRGIKTGINWYLTEDDGTTDGKFTGYLEMPDNRYLDPELYDELRKIGSRPDKSVQMVEEAAILPGVDFYHRVLKSSSLEPSSRERHRKSWFCDSLLWLKDSNLIFADPDNGISYRKTAKIKDSEKFILPEEVRDYFNAGKNVVFYCHKGRRKQDAWETAKTEIRNYVRDAQLLAVTCHRGTQRSYIFVVHPDSYQSYHDLLTEFLQSAWGSFFTWEAVGGNALTASPSGGTVARQICLEPLAIPFSVCKVSDYSKTDINIPFVFPGCTDQEKSLVCPTAAVPENTIEREDGWKAFRISGQLDFSLIGIIAEISRVLADNRIGIVVISTYNTDYVMTKETQFNKALEHLRNAGYVVNQHLMNERENLH